EQPREVLRAFCREEYAHYDAITDSNPDEIEPLDVLVTVAVNSFVNNAVTVRHVHRGMAASCNPLLAAIPQDADLLKFDSTLQRTRELLHAAVQVKSVLLPVATKVLHRKRRWLIPMLDNVVLGHYLVARGRRDLLPKTQDKRTAADAAVEALIGFRED